MICGTILALILGSVLGFQTGKVSQRQDSLKSQVICVDNDFGDGEKACYEVIKSHDPSSEKDQ